MDASHWLVITLKESYGFRANPGHFGEIVDGMDVGVEQRCVLVCGGIVVSVYIPGQDPLGIRGGLLEDVECFTRRVVATVKPHNMPSVATGPVDIQHFVVENKEKIARAQTKLHRRLKRAKINQVPLR